jgi:hypothetical protein
MRTDDDDHSRADVWNAIDDCTGCNSVRFGRNMATSAVNRAKWIDDRECPPARNLGEWAIMISTIGSSLSPLDLASLQQTTGIQSLTASGGTDPDGDGDVKGVNGRSDSANISGPGKLLSQLQHLQAQNPAKFQQVVSDIANKLQTIASEATGSQGQSLSDLASKFQAAANSGDLSGVQSQLTAHGHHHHHHGAGTYNQQGQVTQPTVTQDSAPTGGADLRQLFAGISQEVTQALRG